MMHSRNVDGLICNAQKKRDEAFEKVEAAIDQLLKEGRPISFRVVALTAGVSTAWLYKEREVKERIKHLRSQGVKNEKAFSPEGQTLDLSEDDKDEQALSARLQLLESENQWLAAQLQVIDARQKVFVEEKEARQREIERLASLVEAVINAESQSSKLDFLHSPNEDGQALPKVIEGIQELVVLYRRCGDIEEALRTVGGEKAEKLIVSLQLSCNRF